MVKGAGMKPGGTAGKYIATQAVISGMKAVSSEEEETDENAGVESARLAERETEVVTWSASCSDSKQTNGCENPSQRLS